MVTTDTNVVPKSQRMYCDNYNGYFRFMRDIRHKKETYFLSANSDKPTLIFGPGPKLFYGTCSRKLFKYPIFAFGDHYFDKNELNVTPEV